MATVHIGFVASMTEMGIVAAILTFRDLTDRQIAQVNALAVLVGIAGCAVTAATAVPVGWFFESEPLPALVMVMSLTVFVTAFRLVPLGLLQRDFGFRAIAVAEAIQAALRAIVQIGLAFLGFGYWSLVLGELAGLAVSTLVLMAYRRGGFAWPRRAAIP